MAGRAPSGGVDAGASDRERTLDARLLPFAARWSRRDLVQSSYPYVVSGRVGPVSPADLSRRIARAFEAASFLPQICDLPTSIPSDATGLQDRREAVRQTMMNPRSATPAGWSEGLVMGEREIHVDGPRRRTAIRVLATLAVLFLVLVPLGFLMGYLPAVRSYGGIVYLLGAACGIAAFFSVNPLRAYESEVAVVTYRSTLGAPPPSPATPTIYDLTVSCAHVASSNSGGKREFRAVRIVMPDRPALSEAASHLLAEIVRD